MLIRRLLSVIALVVIVAVVSVLFWFKLSEGYSYAGTCAIQEKYSENGKYYIVVNTPDGSNLRFQCEADDYYTVICSPYVLYDIGYRYYSLFPQRSYMYFFSTAEPLDCRNQQGG